MDLRLVFNRHNGQYYQLGLDHMAITPLCDSCGRELIAPGALLLSPPNAKQQVKKFHSSHLPRGSAARVPVGREFEGTVGSTQLQLY